MNKADVRKGKRTDNVWKAKDYRRMAVLKRILIKYISASIRLTTSDKKHIFKTTNIFISSKSHSLSMHQIQW